MASKMKVTCEECSRHDKTVTFVSKRKYQEHYKRMHKKKTRRKHHNMRPELKKEIKKMYKGKCALCGSKQELQVHHKIHRKHGGTNEPSNLMLLCDLCHAEQHRGENIYHLMIKRIFRPIEVMAN